MLVMNITNDVMSLQKQLEKAVQQQRDASHKIEMIKYLRCLTRLLGKLGLQCCTTDEDAIYRNAPVGWPKRPDNVPRYRYGWGLKFCKDSIEAYLDRKTAAASAAALSVGIVKAESNSV